MNMDAAVNITGHTAQVRYLIDDESKVGEARRAAQAMANLDFDTQTAGRASIVATELAHNLLNHAGGGELLMQTFRYDGMATFELLAIDRGPGMADVTRCMSDGYSTTGTPGTGLGAVRRLASEFDLYSEPGDGTVVMARIGASPNTRYGAVCVTMPGEVECGDAWQVASNGHEIALIVADGLGHGSFAAQAARAAVDAFTQSPFLPPHETLTLAGTAMASTRGGAVACARLNGAALSYSGMGNISGALVTREKSQGLLSHSGTLGMAGRRPQQFEYVRPPGSLVVMHSDGISARWNLAERPALFSHHPAIAAAVLYRDHGRQRDDATIVVLA